MRILLVEDNAIQATISKSFLQMALPSARVTHVESLVEGIASVLHETFELILLDLGLPDSEGLEVVVNMSEAAPDTPIVIVTAQGEEGLGPLCVQAGASDFICKRDLTPEKLARAVEYGVSRRSESVVRDLGRVVSEFRSVAGFSSSAFNERFGNRYEALITGSRSLMTEDHRALIREMGSAGISGPQAIALHADCLENVCRTADDRAQARYLMNCQTVLSASLSYLIDYYRARI